MSSRKIIGLAVASVLLMACGKEVRLQADAIVDRGQIPIMDTKGVTSLISDSGVTRYRINAEHWEIYDQAQPSYMEFKEGVYLEKFSEQLEVEASLQADYAKYLDKEGLWELRGHVHALNEEGEQFDTPLLYWNENTERVYSDSSITIHRATSTIVGIGFESNQSMTEYTILKPTGSFPIDEEE